ncbi:MAG TPA: WD40 repeat domain-containing serine/threonine-protein kinase [Dictyobacter sp.]|jgi:serine/threonine protein kinase|nr:WD40 repeat domain-containing serine/threonine-protein kinase [Dictyobacter sp.]
MVTTSHLYCAHCGAANPQHARFCRVCGSHLEGEHEDGASKKLDAVSVSPSPQISLQANTGPLARGVTLKQRYRILKEIGSGGYGKVYMAADSDFAGRRVAIKEMIQSGLDPQEIHEAAVTFKREAFLLASLTHPNLPSIYDYFTENSRWYLVMSFIEGETLEKYQQKLQDGRVPVEKVIQIGTQLASVLSYLHGRRPPIIFRDLKPANIMRTPDGQIYLIDFGIARHFKQGQAKDTAILGSPGYASPEQYGRAQTTPQTDVYSLGVTLHQLLSGDDPTQSPFHYRPLVLPEYPQMETLISCMLDRDVRKRPASMGNIKRELQRIATGRALPAHDQNSQRLWPSFVSIPAIPSVSTPMPVVKPAQAPMPVTTLSSLSWAPDSKQVALANGQNIIRVVDAQTEQVVKNYAFARGIPLSSVSWSPEGMRMASACSDGTVRVFETGNGVQTNPYPAHSYPVWTAIWSPNGKYIASSDTQHFVHVWNVQNRNTVRIYRHHAARVLSLDWSPDNWHIISGGLDGSVHVWHAISGKMMYWFAVDPVLSVAWSPDSHYIAASTWNAVHIWSALDGRPLSTYRGHAALVTALSWSPDSRFIASASYDHTVRVWAVPQGTQERIYTHHQERVLSLAWSPDGKLLAAGDSAGNLRIWPAH